MADPIKRPPILAKPIAGAAPTSPPAAPTIEPPAPPEPDELENVTQADAVRAADRLIMEEPVRRVESAAKVAQTAEQVSPAQRIKQSLADRGEAKKAPTEYLFMSRYPELTIYVNNGRTENEKEGRVVPAPYRVQFRNGVLRTKNELLAKLVREHPRCGSSLFREELNANAYALREAAAQARNNLRNPTHVGPTASTDGLESVFHAQDHELAQVEQQLFTL